MKLVTTFISVLAFPSTFRADSYQHFVQGDNLSSDTIPTLLDETSNNRVVQVKNVLPKSTSSNDIRTPLEKTGIVPIGMKTYVAGLRTTVDGTNFCSASLISPIHLLAGTSCTLEDIRWASIGSHYVNGTQDGEQIKVVAILTHPKSLRRGFTYDFAVLVLKKPSKFTPVALAKSDDSDVTDGEWAVTMGWDDDEGLSQMGYELFRSNVQLMSNSNCAKETKVTESLLCSRGAASQTSCSGEYSGPVVVERSSGDVIVGLVTWGDDCDKPGYPSIYSRVSIARAWIDSVINGVCFH
ncbi:unnamed protein product [Peronospora farinosa]|uniref:Peptidase S1 domain-containing protein n=1 Tax=Peronospora farinosa TaxID=134698 RepID=A0AAV0SXI2_9STRA|nr:unnamed protein product [Peronospora farinosa]CAI5710268.1 unnamed protein product [Peronospora farinosa]